MQTLSFGENEPKSTGILKKAGTVAPKQVNFSEVVEKEEKKLVVEVKTQSQLDQVKQDEK